MRNTPHTLIYPHSPLGCALWSMICALCSVLCALSSSSLLQVEHKRTNIERERPLAVQQYTALIAVNYAAREKGITRHENAAAALHKCPEIALVHVEVIVSSLSTLHSPPLSSPPSALCPLPSLLFLPLSSLLFKFSVFSPSIIPFVSPHHFSAFNNKTGQESWDCVCMDWDCWRLSVSIESPPHK